MLFDWLIVGQVLEVNPAAAVRAGKARREERARRPVLKADEARQLLDSIPLKIGPEPKEGVEGQPAAQPDRPARPGPDRRHGIQLRPHHCRPRHEG